MTTEPEAVDLEALALAFSSGQQLRPHPFAARLSGALSGGVDQREFVVSETQRDGVASRVVAGGSSESGHEATIPYTESLDQSGFRVYDKGMSNPETLTKNLSAEELTKDVARASKRCRFGHSHSWTFEFDIETGRNSGWVKCWNCGAREWEGE